MKILQKILILFVFISIGTNTTYAQHKERVKWFSPLFDKKYILKSFSSYQKLDKKMPQPGIELSETLQPLQTYSTPDIKKLFYPSIILSIGYSMGITVGSNTRNYSSDISFRGVSIECLHKIRGSLYLGTDFTFQNFYKDFRYSTFNFQGAQVTGYHSNRLNFTNILATGSWFYCDRGEKFEPWIEFGAGIFINNERTNIGSNFYDNRSAQFGIAPEFGILYNTHGLYNYYISTSLKYSIKNKYLPSMSYYAIKVGIVFLHYKKYN